MKENAQSHITAQKVGLLSDAAVALLRSQEKVVEHVISLGYASLLLGCLSTLSVVECENQDGPDLALMVEALLRLLHQMSATLAGAEGLAASRNPELLTVIGPIATATATSVAFSSTVGHRLDGVANSSMGLEIVQRVVSEESRARDAVVKQALSMRLAESLLGELEQWHKQHSGDFHHKPPHEDDSSNIRRVLAINVLTLMSSSGQYSAKVKSILAHSSVWSNYQDQRHDLFLPGGDDDDSVGGIASLASLVQSSTNQEAITYKEEEPRANDHTSCEIQDSPALQEAGDPGEELGIYEDLWPDPPDGCVQAEPASASKAHEDGDASFETTTSNDPEGHDRWSDRANEPTPATSSSDFLDSPDAVLEELGNAGNAKAGAINTFHEANANNHLQLNEGSVQQNAPSVNHSSGNNLEVLGSSNELQQVCVQEEAAKNSVDPPMHGGADHPLG